MSTLKLPQPVRQRYDTKELPLGVSIMELKKFSDMGGYFSELSRIDENGYLSLPIQVPIKARQINFSRVAPGPCVKAWHLHTEQSDIWCVVSGVLLVGLFDARSGSSESPVSLVLTAEKPCALYIPPGIAHGFMNIHTSESVLIYLTDRYFDPDPGKTDEWRFPHDVIPHFWDPQHG